MEIDMHRRMGADEGLSEDGEMTDEMRVKVQKEEEGCTEGVTERGKYYEVEVTVPESDSDEETPTASSPQTTVANADTKKVTDVVTASDFIYEPPECISLVSGAVNHEDNKQTNNTHI